MMTRQFQAAFFTSYDTVRKALSTTKRIEIFLAIVLSIQQQHRHPVTEKTVLYQHLKLRRLPQVQDMYMSYPYNHSILAVVWGELLVLQPKPISYSIHGTDLPGRCLAQ
jgi:hypothetical protein